MQFKADCYQPHHQESYMNQRQKEFFRAKLIAWRERLHAEGEASLQRIRTTENSGGDEADQSVKEHNKVMDYFTRRRTEETIASINAALDRLKDGSYGYCLESGEEIGIKRLLAYPTATLSVEAQEFFEEHQRVRQYSVAL